jgi:hypothetical protein
VPGVEAAFEEVLRDVGGLQDALVDCPGRGADGLGRDVVNCLTD